VIPPDDWAGDQESFRAGLAFRKQLLTEEVDLEALGNRLTAEGLDATDEALRAELVAETLAVPLDRLPEPAQETVREAAAAVIDGDREEAASLLEAEFHSPCEEMAPETVESSGGHWVDCHRYDADAPGEPDVPPGGR
jgi:peptide/nickel transport system ATP-binding protein